MYRGSFAPVRSCIVAAVTSCDLMSEAIVTPVHRAIEAIRPLAFRGQDVDGADITGRCNPPRVAAGFVTQFKETLERDLAPLKVSVSRELQRALMHQLEANLGALNDSIVNPIGEPTED